MDLKRFFSTEIDEQKGTAVLSGEEFFHAVKVTRHRPGFKLIVCGDGDCDYFCTVTEITSDALYASIDGKKRNVAETDTPVTLFIGANKDLDTAVQKAVELGVRRIVPFTSAHGNIARINSERLIKIVLESSKQCGRSRLTEVSDLITFNEAINVAKGTDILFFYEAAERDKRVCRAVFGEREVSVFIGSEGGFSEEERDLAESVGARTLSLGSRILRVSTAVVSALTLVMAKLGEM